MERNDNGMSISLTQALREGVSPEKLRKNFEQALAEAQKTNHLEREAKKESERIAKIKAAQEASKAAAASKAKESTINDSRRENVVLTILSYLDALGWLPEGFKNDTGVINDFCNGIRELEELYAPHFKLLKKIYDAENDESQEDKTPHKNDAASQVNTTAGMMTEDEMDRVINKFLKSLF